MCAQGNSAIRKTCGGTKTLYTNNDKKNDMAFLKGPVGLQLAIYCSPKFLIQHIYCSSSSYWNICSPWHFLFILSNIYGLKSVSKCLSFEHIRLIYLLIWIANAVFIQIMAHALIKEPFTMSWSILPWVQHFKTNITIMKNNPWNNIPVNEDNYNQMKSVC
jgi:hypothetical protein